MRIRQGLMLLGTSIVLAACSGSGSAVGDYESAALDTDERRDFLHGYSRRGKSRRGKAWHG